MGALFGIGPVYAEQSGLGIRDISPFMTAPVVACLLLQWPVGHLSDWLDRRAVISADTWTAGLLPVLALTAAGSTWWLIALMIVFGGLSLSPVCHLHRPHQRLSRTGAESGGAEMPEDTRRASAKARTTAGQGLLLQSFCISTIHGGQMQEVRVQGWTR